MGCDSVVGIATVRAERFAVRTSVEANGCLFSPFVRTVLEPTPPPVKWVSELLPGVKAAGAWR